MRLTKKPSVYTSTRSQPYCDATVLLHNASPKGEEIGGSMHGRDQKNDGAGDRGNEIGSIMDTWRNEVGSIMSMGSFRALLQRERACSDRVQQSFSVLSFRVGWRREAFATLATILRVIAARIRTTDVIGWLPEDELGVLLRYSTAADAMEVAKEIHGRMAEVYEPLRCTVYSYPPFELDTPGRVSPQSRTESGSFSVSSDSDESEEPASASDSPPPRRVSRPCAPNTRQIHRRSKANRSPRSSVSLHSFIVPG